MRKLIFTFFLCSILMIISFVSSFQVETASASSKTWYVDEDGDDDLLLYFKIKDLDFSPLVDESDEYPYTYLYGETNNGLLFKGKDTVRLVQPWQFWLEQIYQRYMLFLIWTEE